VRLGHARDLRRLKDAADLADVEVEARGGAVLDQAGEVELSRQPFAGRDRDRGPPGTSSRMAPITRSAGAAADSENCSGTF
jgi:hypothetical protein